MTTYELKYELKCSICGAIVRENSYVKFRETAREHLCDVHPNEWKLSKTQDELFEIEMKLLEKKYNRHNWIDFFFEQ